jgi:hypothetical protein
VASRDQRTDAGSAHETTAVSFTDLIDLAANGLDPLIERYPVFVEASNQADPRLVTQLAQRPADNVGAKARFSRRRRWGGAA